MKRRSPRPRSRPKDTLRGLASLLLLGYRTVRTNAQNKGRGVQPIHEGEGDINIFNVPGDFNDFHDFRWNDHAYTNNRNSGKASCLFQTTESSQNEVLIRVLQVVLALSATKTQRKDTKAQRNDVDARGNDAKPRKNDIYAQGTNMNARGTDMNAGGNDVVSPVCSEFYSSFILFLL